MVLTYPAWVLPAAQRYIEETIADRDLEWVQAGRDYHQIGFNRWGPRDQTTVDPLVLEHVNGIAAVIRQQLTAAARPARQSLKTVQAAIDDLVKQYAIYIHDRAAVPIELSEFLQRVGGHEPFKDILARLLIEAELTTKVVAAELKVSRTTVEDWLAGALPGRDHETALAALLTRRLGRRITFDLPYPRPRQLRTTRARKTRRKTLRKPR